jgi:hypothetical protein
MKGPRHTYMRAPLRSCRMHLVILAREEMPSIPGPPYRHRGSRVALCSNSLADANGPNNCRSRASSFSLSRRRLEKSLTDQTRVVAPVPTIFGSTRCIRYSSHKVGETYTKV